MSVCVWLCLRVSACVCVCLRVSVCVCVCLCGAVVVVVLSSCPSSSFPFLPLSLPLALLLLADKFNPEVRIQAGKWQSASITVKILNFQPATTLHQKRTLACLLALLCFACCSSLIHTHTHTLSLSLDLPISRSRPPYLCLSSLLSVSSHPHPFLFSSAIFLSS